MTPGLTYEAIQEHARHAIGADLAALSFHNFSSFVSSSSSPRPLSFLFEQLYDQRAHGMRPHHVEEANSYLEAVIRPPADATVVTIPRQGHSFPTGICSYSEEAFTLAARQLYEPLSEYDTHSELSVYHNEYQQPVLFRKKNDESCALVLAPLRLSGSNILVPPGAIVSVGGLNKKDVTGTTYVEQTSRSRPISTLRSIAFDSNKHPVLPLRLSAWAFPQAIDRSLYALGGYRLELDSKRLEYVTEHSLDDYRQVAADLLKLCFGNATTHLVAPALQPARPSLTPEGIVN
jgi:hypothetical protein